MFPKLPSVARICAITRSLVLSRTLHTSSTRLDIFKIQDTADFDDRVLKNPKLVIVDFFATWCGPCKIMGPRLETIVGSKDVGGQVDLAMVDVDEQESLAGKYRVSTIPAVFALKNGQIVDQFVGQKDEDELKRFIANVMKK